MRKPKRRTNYLLLGGFALGLGFMPGYTYIRESLQNWLGQIVISAVHQHWQFEQKALLFKPADSNQM